MRSGLRIGKILGINIRVDWSWLFIFFLVTVNLSSVFGQYHSSWNQVLKWSMAVIAALLFFTSVLVHELAHSLVAQARGIPIRNITLFLFGGVSSIQRDPDSPRAEFLMAIMGPITSIVLGGILVTIVAATSAPLNQAMQEPRKLMAQLSPLSTLLLWLGTINIILGIFNLIPGFPLDGGRVLRSILWALTDNLRRATRWATWAGQGIAWVMIFNGIAMAFGAQVPFFGTGVVNGLWLAFIGWFLNSASVQSYQRVVIQDILEGVPVTRMMRTNPPIVSPDKSVGNLVHDHVMQTDDNSFPVIENEQLIGLVTLEDVKAVSREAWDHQTVRDIMTPTTELVTITTQDDAAEGLNKLTHRDVRQVPVMRGRELAGLLRRRDIIKWLQLESELDIG